MSIITPENRPTWINGDTPVDSQDLNNIVDTVIDGNQRAKIAETKSTEATEAVANQAITNAEFKTGINNTISEFKTDTTAEVDRLAELIAEGGTVVNVGGIPKDTIDFDSDPQTQITSLKNEATDKWVLLNTVDTRSATNTNNISTLNNTMLNKANLDLMNTTLTIDGILNWTNINTTVANLGRNITDGTIALNPSSGFNINTAAKYKFEISYFEDSGLEKTKILETITPFTWGDSISGFLTVDYISFEGIITYSTRDGEEYFMVPFIKGIKLISTSILPSFARSLLINKVETNANNLSKNNIEKWKLAFGYSQFKGTEGHSKLPNGFLVKWGTLNMTANQSVTVTFGVNHGGAFPTACYGVFTNFVQAGYAAAAGGSASSWSRTNIGFRNLATASTMCWFAIGF